MGGLGGWYWYWYLYAGQAMEDLTRSASPGQALRGRAPMAVQHIPPAKRTWA